MSNKAKTHEFLTDRKVGQNNTPKGSAREYYCNMGFSRKHALQILGVFYRHHLAEPVIRPRPQKSVSVSISPQ